MKYKISYLILLFLISFHNLAFAAARQQVGLGGVAQNLMEPVDVLSSFINSACFIIGGAFLFACIIKYIEYRRNPFATSLSTVIFLLIAGLFLLSLPLLSYLTGFPF